MSYKIKDPPKYLSISACKLTLIDWLSVDCEANMEDATKKEVYIDVDFDDPSNGFFYNISVKDGNGNPSKASFEGGDLKKLGEFLNSFADMMDKMRDKAITAADESNGSVEGV